MKGNYWQTEVEVAFSFGLFGRFPDFLPLGQQYLPLNRKPSSRRKPSLRRNFKQVKCTLSSIEPISFPEPARV